MVYVSEVCHFYKDRGDCYGGGMYIDPVFPAYDVKACVGKTEYTIVYLSEEKNKKYSQRGTYELLVEICMQELRYQIKNEKSVDKLRQSGYNKK